MGGLILAAIGVFVIERQLDKTAYFTLPGAALTFFGFIHGEAIGFAKSPLVALSYLMVAAILYGCARFAIASPAAAMSGVHEPAPQPGH